MSHPPAQPRRHWLFALTIALVLTLLATLYVRSMLEASNRRELELIDFELVARVHGRLQAHAQVLRSAAAFFASSIEVTRQEWQTFAQKSNLDLNLPGIQGLGFALLIPPERLAAHEQSIRTEGFPDYRVWPAGERPVYTSIVYLEPFAGRNLRAFGYDMFAEPVRRAAMERARDQDQAVLTGKVQLVQDTGQGAQAGALMYVPIYRAGLPSGNPLERRAALVGWVYSPYRMNDLMQGILGNLLSSKFVRLAIYDGERITPGTLLYDSAPHRDREPVVASDPVDVPLEFNGHRWTLVVSPAAPFASAGTSPLVLSVAGGGTLISILLAALLRALGASRGRAAQLIEELAARRHAESALREHESLLQSVLDNIPFELWARDAHGCMFLANPVLMQHWGKVLGTRPEDAATCAAELALWHSNNARVMAGEVLDQEAECVLRGEQRFFRRIVAPIRLGEEVRGILGFNIDITALKQAQAELEHHRDHLEELVYARTRELAETRDLAESASRAKSAFLAKISHELRTPMNQIMGLGYLLSKDLPNAQAQQRLANIARASKHLLGLIDDILTYSQSQAQQIRVEATPFDLLSLLDHAERRTHQDASDKGLELVREVDPELPVWLIGDLPRLRQILGQLLSNAVKFSERGPIILRVRQCEAQHHRRLVRFEVADQGIGIAPQAQAGLFELFNQVDNSSTRKYGGTGLGLALSKRLVALMAGEIGFVSTPGQGSRFWFSVWFAVGTAPAERVPVTGPSDGRQVDASVASLEALLAAGDYDALTLWRESRQRLAPVLCERLAAFDEAIGRFDLTTALALLRAATTIGRAQARPGVPILRERSVNEHCIA